MTLYSKGQPVVNCYTALLPTTPERTGPAAAATEQLTEQRYRYGITLCAQLLKLTGSLAGVYIASEQRE